MALVIALVVVLAVLCAGGLVMWARLAHSNTRVIGMPGGEPDEFFWGGVMCRYVITSGLTRLEFFDWGVRLRGVALSRWAVPTWEAKYDELAIASLVALPQSRIAVWLRVRGESTAIAFLSDRATGILPVFEQHGVPVNRSVTRIRRVEELYQATPG